MFASAAVPWGFDPVDIDGRRYVDGGWEDMGGDNIPVAPILDRNPEIKTIIVVRCNCAADEPESLETSIPRATTLVEVRPRRTLRGVLDIVDDLLPDTSFLSDVPFVGPVSQRLDYISRSIRIWSGTFAFNGECANRFIRQGHVDGLATLRQLKPRETLEW